MGRWILRMRIDGFQCAGCVNRIENAMNAHGADRVDIDASRHFGTVTFTGTQREGDFYVETIEALGYNVKKLAVVDAENDA